MPEPPACSGPDLMPHGPMRLTPPPGAVDTHAHVFHIQNVNAYDSRGKGWMQPFLGVATKYLTSTVGWRRLIEDMLIEDIGSAINPAAIVMRCRQHSP